MADFSNTWLFSKISFVTTNGYLAKSRNPLVMLEKAFLGWPLNRTKPMSFAPDHFRLSCVIRQLLTVLLSLSTLTVSAQATSPVIISKPGSLSKPSSLTLPKQPKFPGLNLPCKLSSGEDRPFPCEFRLDRIVFYNINGTLLGQITPTTNEITVPFAKAVNSHQATTTVFVVNARFFFTRVNPPNFQQTKLLLTEVTHSLNASTHKLENAPPLAVVSEVLLGQSFQSILYPLVWNHKHKGEKQLSFIAELYPYLPTTRDKLKEKYGANLSLKDQSETSKTITLTLTYE